MKTQNNKLQHSLGQTAASLAALEAMENEICGTQPDRKFLDLIQQWGQGKFRLVVIGEAKQGKSSLVNALTGIRDLVSVHPQIATSTIFRISHGPEVSYEVIFMEESGKAPLTIKREQLDSYGTENGNPGNREQVEYIRVTAPSPLLASGLEIVDTPGLGGLVSYHKQVTYRYLTTADAALFVTDSVSAPLGKNEAQALHDLRQVTDHVFFVQTKSRAASSSSVEAFRQRNMQTITSPDLVGMAPEDVAYFVVDSEVYFDALEEDREDLREMSGFPLLEEFMTKTLPDRKLAIILRRAFQVSRPKMEMVKGKISSEGAIWRKNKPEELREMLKTLESLREENAHWIRSEAPKFRAEIKRAVNFMFQKMGEPLDDLPPNGPFHMQMLGVVQEITSAHDLKCASEDIASEVRKQYAQAEARSNQILKSECDKLFDRLEQMGGSDTIERKAHGAQTSFDRASPLDSYESKSVNGFDATRNALSGAMIGAMIGSIVPVAGTAIGTALGGWLGFKRVQEDSFEKSKQMLLSQLSQTVSIFYASLQSSMRKLQAEVNAHIDESITYVTVAKTEEIDNSIKSLNKSMVSSKEEIVTRLQVIQAWEKRYDSILNTLRAMYDVI